MTDKEKLEKLKKLADKMYDAAFNLTTDASLLRKAMKEYHQFIINEYHKEEPVSEDFEKIVEEIAEPTILNAYGTKELARRLRNTICGTSVSDDLEDAAEKYAYKLFPSVGVANTETELAFKAGAKWQKEKMIANTADAMIGLPYENKDGGYTHLIDVSRPLPVGNNKIAIIFKED